jgi:ubiquinone/menaquinone biosynthesis C-methylase UbiE
MLVTQELAKIFACPVCLEPITDGGGCIRCGESFKKPEAGIYSFVCRGIYQSEAEFDAAAKVIDFWGNGWTKRLAEADHSFLFEMDAAQLRSYADQSTASCRQNKTLMGLEVPLEQLQNKSVLNIGCGAGDEALMLSRAGATCFAMDITLPAAQATNSLLCKVGGGIGFQADARHLPFPSGSIDFVYSSGVLHHSADIKKSISEIYRVLKPGGTAYLMLYAKWSITFMQEKLLRWTGEAAWETEGRKNPLTTTHSARDCRKLFADFEQVNVNKRGGSFRNIAKIGRFLPQTFDFLVDKTLGANMNIVAIKPAV